MKPSEAEESSSDSDEVLPIGSRSLGSKLSESDFCGEEGAGCAVADEASAGGEEVRRGGDSLSRGAGSTGADVAPVVGGILIPNLSAICLEMAGVITSGSSGGGEGGVG